ncbi:MAG: leucine-rich repeat domain-containing protein, partial [Prevotellaceae bacterium]|nr:leucine-rich repeat domain-containing protein [Prevotellaceae bacterium]
MALCLCAISKAVAQEVASGTTGACTWVLTGTADNYTLTGSGSGATDGRPWDSYQNDIKTVVIQEGVTAIGGEHAFSGCSSLAEVAIPHSVTAIENWAFGSCGSLKDVYVKAATPPELRDEAFSNIASNATLHVPCEKKDAYSESAWEGYFSDANMAADVFSGHTITVLSSNPAMGTAAIASVDCDAATVTIVATATGCNKFHRWKSGDTDNPHYFFEDTLSVTVTQDTAFTAEFGIDFGQTGACTWVLTEEECGNGNYTLTISGSGATDGQPWYSYQNDIKTVVIQEGVTAIGQSAFSGCSSLAEV